MSKCGITAQHLTHPLRIDPSWFPTTSASLVVARWDLYDNAIRSEDAMLDDIEAPSLFTTLKSVCKSITEIDVNGNPPGCNELFLPFNGAKIIHNILQQGLPDHHHPVQKRPPPPHHRRSAGEWEVILTRLLSSIINDALNKVSGRRMKDRKPYIRVFGSALSGFSLSSEESDVDAVVLLEGEEKFSEGILEEGS
ncbi:hypothetical protein Pmar_PMAR020799 [Perkinsus marinus ATCC 50983]|uniref:Uncharacterized protein n=2 Tax=Perkinsus marinus (strain ATCC 50983 / TXsc) TaxID=423536 RepID=C5L290_PERM5|nr:hypothetical protein Pmar_PMAR020799 [Perkinsus marinus ATCC 50983]EER09154.1 hypothetical protein Pmar_PMAR020799 [Perkinsus marinus ATCC 50983]|eukprot:XP_002777338.1 hypothetical protein Pmar_PMAR020799 [Perkinsus marinus ATCC 50983]